MNKIFLALFIIAGITFAQELFMPWNIKQVYDGGTRSYTGEPGEKYWQNSADYFISATLEPSKNLLTGREEIIYHNNSPDGLTKLVLRLYPNYFKKGAARDNPIYAEDVNDGMIINSLSINGEPVKIEENPNVMVRGTNMIIKMDSEIAPGSSAAIEAEWTFYIPRKTKMRMGQYDSTSFYIAYWYPQVAVYDDVDGWDTYNYGGTAEFYNDFNNYNVEITVPEGFLVWAAGINNNIDELLKPEILERWEKARTSDEVIGIVTEADYEQGFPTIEDGFNAWSFTANNITDFTFGTSDHYLWDMGSLVVDSASGRRTVVDAAYKNESEDFYEVAEIAIKSIRYFSYEMPAVPFPYPKLTVFNGGGGMEAPMMVNDGSASSIAGTVGVTSHEIAHTYFPFYMGINERKYAWMDEGWATMLPLKFQNEEGGSDPLLRNVRSFSYSAGNEIELPMMIPTVLMRGQTYRVAAYIRPGLAYYFLFDMLGRDDFLKALHLYMDRWHGKHPLPYDFFFSFNEALGENLNWYWKPWFFERGYPDLGVEYVKEKKGSFKIAVKKIGSIPVPAALTVTYFDGSTEELYKDAGVWEHSDTVEFFLKTPNRIKSVMINTSKTPDVNKENNEWVLE